MIAAAATQSGSLSQTGSLRPTGLASVGSFDSNGVRSKSDQDDREGKTREQRLRDTDRKREVKNLPELREEKIDRVDQRQHYQ